MPELKQTHHELAGIQALEVLDARSCVSRFIPYNLGQGMAQVLNRFPGSVFHTATGGGGGVFYLQSKAHSANRMYSVPRVQDSN